MFGIEFICSQSELNLSEFVWTLRSSVLVVFNNFLLIDATDKSKISSNQKWWFFAVSHSFSRTIPLSIICCNEICKNVLFTLRKIITNVQVYHWIPRGFNYPFIQILSSFNMDLFSIFDPDIVSFYPGFLKFWYPNILLSWYPGILVILVS